LDQHIEQPSDDIARLLGRAGELKAQLEANQLDREGLQEVKNNFDAVKEQINELQRAEDQRRNEAEQKAILSQLEALTETVGQLRTPSKADMVLGGGAPGTSDDHFFAALALARSRDYEEQQAGKARLADMGSSWAGVHPESKATVGDTDAAGGYLVPNNVVADINLQAQPGRTVVDLFTVIDGVRGSGVDIPWEQSADSRAVIAAPGQTKENSNFIVNNYTATLYTLARIFDVGNQLLRRSEGAAERLVRSKLARAFALGEDYYAIQGSGTSEPYGLLTAIGTSGTYVTTHSSPSASTIAGNWATAIANASGALANRGATPDAVVMNSGDYWTSISAGDPAGPGFFVSPMGGAFGFNAAATGTIGAGPWGLRLAHTPNMPSDSLVVGEYRAAMFFRGQGYRVDVSSEAGDRWDKNLTGFRGEEEIAFDARPAVYTGRFQRITNVMP
jgi:HK97 family phage major capsid protein